MKYLILAGDGMADFPLASLGDRTPLQCAHIPHMDALTIEGCSGLFCPIPEGLLPGSDIGNLSLFGYDPRAAYTGRAPLEAASQGISLSPSELAFRCNLVTIKDGLMADFTVHHIPNEDAAPMIANLHTALSREFPIALHPGVSYRNLLILRTTPDNHADLASVSCTPPHDISGQQTENHLPSGAGSDILHAIMSRAREILSTDPTNIRRLSKGDIPASDAWLWGQGGAPILPTYAQLHGITGAVISAVDLVRGIGVCAGLSIIRVQGATGYLDTNYKGKVDATLGALGSMDFAYLHIEAPDETAHEGNAQLKIKAIEDFDFKVVGPCLAWAREQGDCRILLAPDHITSINTRTHAQGPVPFAIWGPSVSSNHIINYDEKNAAASGLCVHAGHKLTNALIHMPMISKDNLAALDV